MAWRKGVSFGFWGSLHQFLSYLSPLDELVQMKYTCKASFRQEGGRGFADWRKMWIVTRTLRRRSELWIKDDC
jgi:hypothetical protein